MVVLVAATLNRSKKDMRTNVDQAMTGKERAVLAGMLGRCRFVSGGETSANTSYEDIRTDQIPTPKTHSSCIYLDVDYITLIRRVKLLTLILRQRLTAYLDRNTKSGRGLRKAVKQTNKQPNARAI